MHGLNLKRKFRNGKVAFEGDLGVISNVSGYYGLFKANHQKERGIKNGFKVALSLVLLI